MVGAELLVVEAGELRLFVLHLDCCMCRPRVTVGIVVGGHDIGRVEVHRLCAEVPGLGLAFRVQDLEGLLGILLGSDDLAS